MTTSKVWFITGSSRGLGLALVKEALAAGHRVAATARNPESAELAALAAAHPGQLLPVKLDVCVPEQVGAALEQTLETFGEIDVVVNNAGFGFTGAFEEMSAADFDRQIDTNFRGTVHVSRAIVPYFRRRGRGHLIQVTSIGGRLGYPGLSGYHAAKFAVEGFSEVLAAELAPLGVKLTIVEPGGFRTDWAGPSMDYAEPMEAYEASVGALRRLMATFSGHEPGDPAKAAQTLLKLAELEEAPLRLPLGRDAMLFLRTSYERSLAELERWAAWTEATDFEGVEMREEIRQLAGAA